jgi:hypothetical protein
MFLILHQLEPCQCFPTLSMSVFLLVPKHLNELRVYNSIYLYKWMMNNHEK